MITDSILALAAAYDVPLAEIEAEVAATCLTCWHRWADHMDIGCVADTDDAWSVCGCDCTAVA